MASYFSPCPFSAHRLICLQSNHSKLVLSVQLPNDIYNTICFTMQDSLPYLYPYLKLINGDRQSTVAAWKSVDQIDRRIVYPATPIPEIAAKGE